MAAPLSPFAIAQAVAHNLVPLAGILFLGWSAQNVMILYFADTLFAMVVMFAGLLRSFIPPSAAEGWAARVNAEVGYVGGGLFLAAVVGFPLGVPLLFILADVSWSDLLADPAFRSGLVLQAIAAFWSGRDLYRALKTHTPEELRVKRRFALVLLRWMAVIVTMYTGLPFLLGRFAPLFFVAVYAIATIMIEVAPDKFLRAVPDGAEDAAPLPPTPPAAPLPRRKRRR